MNPALLAAAIGEPTSDDIVKIIAVSGALFIAVVAIVFGTIVGAIKNGQREKSRRDIAAFVAEGSMTADEGERLLKAGATRSAWHEKS
jgi:hypothetical protein